MIKSITYSWQQHREKTWVFLDQAVWSGSNFIVGLMLTRVLGLAELGVYAFAWMMLMFCSSLQQSIVSTPMVQQWAKAMDKQQFMAQMGRVQVWVSLLLAVGSWACLSCLGSLSFFHALQGVKWELPALIFGYLCYDFYRRSYFLTGEHLRAFLWDVLVNGAQVLWLFLPQWRYAHSLEHTLAFFACTYYVGLSGALVRGKKGDWKLAGTGQEIVSQLKQGQWLLAASIIQWFAGNFFLISAGSLLGPEAAGIVRIAQSIVGVLNVFFIALELYAPPRVAEIYQRGGRTSLLRYMWKLLLLGVGGCSLFALLIALNAHSLIMWMYGKVYVPYAHVVSLFAFFYVLVYVGYPLRFALRAIENTKALFVAYVMAVVFSLLFAHGMVKEWGVMGVLVGLAASQLLMQAWYVKELIWKR